jgi:magnesium chelatase family protein
MSAEGAAQRARVLHGGHRLSTASEARRTRFQHRIRARHPAFSESHHTISDAGLIGGGTLPRPGEISLAHNGVLFLDELPEFQRHVLDVLRQPLEDGQVVVSRLAMSLTFPSSFMLVAAMNPCPCGFYTDPNRECTCTMPQILRYRSKISGPLLDRIDIHIEVPAVRYRDLTEERSGEDSESIKRRVDRAREIQRQRFGGKRIYCNAQMSSRYLKSSRIDLIITSPAGICFDYLLLVK